MENLAKAIVDSVTLFSQLMDKWANEQANVAITTQIPVGDSITSIFSNMASFLAQLTSEILALI
ncbi:MAG: hypothetical protein A2Z70_03760 [Chloroflexi bacterium RBG_13_48_17]|nr:MAG: hypothetical protein A2Z70_03760 [Chloroflexi bacterium RBG_13_48_17]